jgi:WD40 repeat protein
VILALAACAPRSVVEPIDPQSLEKTREWSGGFTCAVFRSDGTLLAGTSGGEVLDGEIRKTAASAGIGSIAPDGTLGDFQGRVHAGGAAWKGHEGTVWAVAPGGVASSGADGVTRIWRGSEAVATIEGTHSDHNVLVPAPGGRLVTCMQDGSVGIFDREGREVARLSSGRPMVGAALASDGRTLFVGTMDGMVEVWDLPTREKVREFPTGGGRFLVPMALTPDDRLLVLGDGPVLRVFEAATGKRRATRRAHRSAICSVAASPDGRRIATVSADGMLILWEAKAGPASAEK